VQSELRDTLRASLARQHLAGNVLSLPAALGAQEITSKSQMAKYDEWNQKGPREAIELLLCREAPRTPVHRHEQPRISTGACSLALQG